MREAAVQIFGWVANRRAQLQKTRLRQAARRRHTGRAGGKVHPKLGAGVDSEFRRMAQLSAHKLGEETNSRLAEAGASSPGHLLFLGRQCDAMRALAVAAREMAARQRAQVALLEAEHKRKRQWGLGAGAPTGSFDG